MGRDWWNRFIASDPALRRLRTAVRVTLSVVVTLAVMFPLLTWWGRPLSSVIVGAIVAIQSSVAVNDPTERARRITTLLMPLPACASLLVATLTRAVPVVQVLAFLVVIFVATYIRRFGPRWFALGFVGFFGYFFAMFLKPTLPGFPAMALCAVCGALAAFLLRFVVLRDAPEGILNRGRRTLRAQVHGLLSSVGELARDPDSAKRRRELRTRSVRLNETALMLEDTVQHLAGLSESSRELLRRRLLDVELAAENLLTPLRQTIARADSTTDLPDVIAPLTRVLRSDATEIRETGRRVAELIEQRGSPETAMTVRRLAAGLAELARATGELGGGHRDDEATDEQADTEDGTDTDTAGEDTSPETDTGLRRPEVRAAVQVTVATGLAILGGHLISPNRWYWAVITAFVVFVSANSRGELLVRAWQRTAGTMLGVVAGILVAAQVTGHIVIEMGLVLVCVFLAFYFLGYSYSVLTFFITTMLGVVYGILGVFNVGVLETRLAETAVGAAAGVLAAVMILPMRTKVLVRTRFEEFLTQLRDMLRQAGTEIDTSGRVTGLREATRELDDRVHGLLSSARPLTTYRLRSQHGSLDRRLTIVQGSAYYARNLAAVLPAAVEMVDADTRERVAELLWAVADAADDLARERGPTENGATVASGSDGPVGEHERDFDRIRADIHDRVETLQDLAEALPSGPSSLHRCVSLLERLAQTLVDLSAETTPGARTVVEA